LKKNRQSQNYDEHACRKNPEKLGMPHKGGLAVKAGLILFFGLIRFGGNAELFNVKNMQDQNCYENNLQVTDVKGKDPRKNGSG